MLRWNKVINLTRIENEGEAVDRHYGESLLLGMSLPAGPLKVADIGSGAGFPGFPIAVLRPEVSVTLIEAHQRKAVFLKEATRGLANLAVVSKRAEDMVGSFDWVVSRAVSWDIVRAVGLRLAPQVAFLGTDGGLGDMQMTVAAVPWEPRHHIYHVSRETP